MASRDLTPIRRAAREEARVWPVALVLVGVYLVLSHWAEPDTPAVPVDTFATEQTQ